MDGVYAENRLERFQCAFNLKLKTIFVRLCNVAFYSKFQHYWILKAYQE